jgi:acyl-CoA thioester hydrolase
MNNKLHQLPVRIYFEDTDRSGIFYYANYFKYAKCARTELLRLLGIESRQMMHEFGLGLAVWRCHAEYLKPAVLDDQVMVQTELQKSVGLHLSCDKSLFAPGMNWCK